MMKRKYLLCFIPLILAGCSMNPQALKADAYQEELLEKYDETKAIEVYNGTYFEAKLTVMDAYVRDNQTMYFNYQLYLKPLDNLNTKKLTVRMKLNEKQAAYYGGTPGQTVFSTITYPMVLNQKTDVPCLEFNFSVDSSGFQELSQDEWKIMMSDLRVEVSWGSHKEIIHFHPDDKPMTYSANNGEFLRSFGKIQ
jgi:uncharacterized protein YcfL